MAIRMILAKDINDTRLIAKHEQEITGDAEQGRLRLTALKDMASILDATPSAKIDATVQKRPYEDMSDDELDAAMLAEAAKVKPNGQG